MNLRKRIIPCILISEGDLIKTKNFHDRKYIGDPLNAIRIFNQKKADEIIILDIDAYSKQTPINFDLIEKMANESRMPISYGGGIKSIDEIDTLIKSGIEKVISSSLFFQDFSTLQKAIYKFGSQSISICLDYRLNGSDYSFFINNGKDLICDSLEEIILKVKELKCGEVIFNSIDKEGLMLGMDKYSMQYLPSILNEIPLSFIGGLSSYDELKTIIGKYKISGVAAGSLFVFKGKHFAVLINYDNFLNNG